MGIGGSLAATTSASKRAGLVGWDNPAEAAAVAEQCAPLPVPTFTVRFDDPTPLKSDPRILQQMLNDWGWSMEEGTQSADALLRVLLQSHDRQVAARLFLPDSPGADRDALAVHATCLSLVLALLPHADGTKVDHLAPLWPPAVLMVPEAAARQRDDALHNNCRQVWTVSPLPSKHANERLRQVQRARGAAEWPFRGLVVLLPPWVQFAGAQTKLRQVHRVAHVIPLLPLVEHTEPRRKESVDLLGEKGGLDPAPIHGESAGTSPSRPSAPHLGGFASSWQPMEDSHSEDEDEGICSVNGDG